MKDQQNRIDHFNETLVHSAPQDVLAFFCREFQGKVTFSSSLGAEDQVITWMIANETLPVRIFTLDTGRLFPETYDLLDITIKKYGVPIDVMFPDARRVQEMVNEKGINLFYESIENRKLCCHIRKVEPMTRALDGMKVWITGVRKDQSSTRTDMQLADWDANYGIIKVNPLINWSEQDVWDFIKQNRIPYNTLHDKGFPSIGCQPCTRAILPGEDLRAGRWWWEHPDTRECGLHTDQEK
jgi:phosphoadenosine phosphosulfate reductase